MGVVLARTNFFETAQALDHLQIGKVADFLNRVSLKDLFKVLFVVGQIRLLVELGLVSQGDTTFGLSLAEVQILNPSQNR